MQVGSVSGATSVLPSYWDGDDEAKARGLYQLVDESGRFDAAAIAWLDRKLGRKLYEGMLLIRVTDARMIALQRQGRIGFYGEALGQEAAVVGSAAASAPQDWIIPAARYHFLFASAGNRSILSRLCGAGDLL